MDNEKTLARIFKQKLLCTPGTTFNYSNSGYTLLAFIVEQVSGMAYPDYLARYIFNPLNMTETGFHGDIFANSNMATGYGDRHYKENEPGRWPKPGGALLGNGGVISSAYDLLKLVNGLKTNQILGPSSFNEMIQPYLINTRYVGIHQNDTFQADAWNVYDDTKLGKVIFTGGANNYGFVSRLVYYKDRNAVLIIMMNNFSKSVKDPVISESVIKEIKDILYGHQ
jgi:CubicO group peptidase (beta-lactamase class C family)